MNLNFQPYPSATGYTLLGEDPTIAIKRGLNDGQEMEVYVDLNGARKVSTHIQVGQTRLGLNVEIEGFKFHEETSFNHFSYEHVTRHYFKKLKSQGLEEYKRYLQAALEQLEQTWGIKLTQPSITVYCRAF